MNSLESILESATCEHCEHCEAPLGTDFANIFECTMVASGGHWVCGDCCPSEEEDDQECPYAGLPGLRLF